MYNRKSFSSNTRGLFVPAAAFLVAATTFLVGKKEVLAGQCKPVYGHFIEQVIVPTGSTCNSPVGFCIKGRAIGRLKGDFVATLTSAIPSQDTPTTAVVFSTRAMVIF